MITSNFPILDPLDLRIMEELESDARQTYESIAAKVSASRPTVMRRIQQLLDSGVIRFLCWADPMTLGYKLNVTLSINTEANMVGAVADRLASYRQVRHAYLCTGCFDIIAWAIFREKEDLTDFLLNELGNIPGIQHIEKMVTLQQIKVQPKLLTDENELPQTENPSVELDDMNLRLIRELQINARQKTWVLAHKLGVSRPTVSKRIQSLTNTRIIRIITSIDPFALGYEVMANIGLKCEPAKVKEVAEVVAFYKNVQYVAICAGRYDISTWVAFQKLSDLRHFITVDLASIPGLKDTETTINHKLIKAV